MLVCMLIAPLTDEEKLGVTCPRSQGKETAELGLMSGTYPITVNPFSHLIVSGGRGHKVPPLPPLQDSACNMSCKLCVVFWSLERPSFSGAFSSSSQWEFCLLRMEGLESEQDHITQAKRPS